MVRYHLAFSVNLIKMLVWLSWQSSSLVMSRSPVRIRPQAPENRTLPSAVFLMAVRLKSEKAMAPPFVPQWSDGACEERQILQMAIDNGKPPLYTDS